MPSGRVCFVLAELPKVPCSSSIAVIFLLVKGVGVHGNISKKIYMFSKIQPYHFFLFGNPTSFVESMYKFVVQIGSFEEKIAGLSTQIHHVAIHGQHHGPDQLHFWHFDDFIASGT